MWTAQQAWEETKKVSEEQRKLKFTTSLAYIEKAIENAICMGKSYCKVDPDYINKEIIKYLKEIYGYKVKLIHKDYIVYIGYVSKKKYLISWKGK